MNRKGFTLIELLAAVVILGIISSFGMITFMSYKDRSARKAFKLINSSAAQAAEDYFMENPSIDMVEIKDLVEEEYLEPAIDPWDKNATCVGQVDRELKPNNKKQGDAIDLYTYKVQLKCSHGCLCVEYPSKITCTCEATYQ